MFAKRIMSSVVYAAALAGCQPTASGPQSAPPTSHVADASADAGRMIMSNDGVFAVRYSTQPSPLPMNQPFVIDVQVEARAGGANQPIALQVDAGMPEHGHGMNVEPTIVDNGRGRFRVEGLLFHMSGRWEIYFDVTRDGITSRAQDEISLE